MMRAINKKSLLGAGVLLISCVALYGFSNPIGPRNGDTWQGYTLGIVATLLVLALMLLGARRRWWIRRYSQQQWLATHWLMGSLLLPVVLLHSGFQTGNGLHALLFVIMLLDLISGFYGLYLYQSQPKKLRNLSAGGGSKHLREILTEVDDKLIEQARTLAPALQAALVSAIQRTWLPKGALALLFGRDQSHLLLPHNDGYQLVNNAKQRQLVNFLQHHKAPDAIQQAVAERNHLLLRHRQSILTEWVLGNWLSLHLQLSLLFVALLLVHIVVVLIY